MIGQEKGFSMINLMVAVAITTMVALGALITTFHVVKSTKRNEEHVRVTQQAQNLGRWFSRDAMMADSISLTDNPGTGDEEFLTIYWKDWESGEAYDICYILLDDADSLMQVRRNQVKRNLDGDVTENFTTLMADSIYSVNITQLDRTWILNIETHCGQKSSIKEYKITKRLT